MPDGMENIYQGILENKDISRLISEVFLSVQLNSDRFSPMWHALGFVHCKLHENSRGALRLHIWPKAKRGALEQKYKIHDHIFSLKSYVVYGEVTNINYELTSIVGQSAECLQLFRVKYHADGSSLVPTQKFYKVECKEKFITIKGGTYIVERGTFHESIINRDRVTVTLVATYDHVNNDPKLLGYPNESSELFRKRDGLPSEEWTSLLNDINRLIMPRPNEHSDKRVK